MEYTKQEYLLMLRNVMLDTNTNTNECIDYCRVVRNMYQDTEDKIRLNNKIAFWLLCRTVAKVKENQEVQDSIVINN